MQNASLPQICKVLPKTLMLRTGVGRYVTSRLENTQALGPKSMSGMAVYDPMEDRSWTIDY